MCCFILEDEKLLGLCNLFRIQQSKFVDVLNKAQERVYMCFEDSQEIIEKVLLRDGFLFSTKVSELSDSSVDL